MLDISDIAICGVPNSERRSAVSDLGALVRSRRLRLGWTQKQLEARTGVSQHYISQIELGSVRHPGDRHLTALSRALDIPLDELKRAMGWVVERKEVILAEGVMIQVRGIVPADTVRWTSSEGASVSEVRVLPEEVGDARDPFGLEVSGDCMRPLGIFAGDVVIVEPANGRAPRDGQLVVVRVGDEVALKRYRHTGSRVRLEDGSGAVVYELVDHDDFEVLAFYVTFKPRAPR